MLWIAARSESEAAAVYEQGAWQIAYLAMAASMLVGVATVLLSREPMPRDAGAERAERARAAERFLREGVHFSWPQALFFVSLLLLLATLVRAPMGGVGIGEVVVYALMLAVAVAGMRYAWGEAKPWRVRVAPGAAPALAWVTAW